MQGEAVATVGFLEGTTVDWVVDELDELLELLDELLEELLELGGGRQGGTISVVTLLLAGRTSSFMGIAPEAIDAGPPPGVMRMVLAGGGATAMLLLLALMLLLELLLLSAMGDPHGSIATVWVKVLLGMAITLEPGGTLGLPAWVTEASEQGGTAIVKGLCCLGMTTSLTPGFMSAIATGSIIELLLELPPPPPQPTKTPAIAAHVVKAATTRVAAELALLMFSSGPLVGTDPSSLSRLGALCHRPLASLLLPPARGSLTSTYASRV